MAVAMRIGVDIHHLRLDARGIYYYLWNTLEGLCRLAPQQLTLYLYGQPWMNDPRQLRRLKEAFPAADVRHYWDGPSLRLLASRHGDNGTHTPWLARQIDRRLLLPLYRKVLAFAQRHPNKGRLVTWPWHDAPLATAVDVFHHAAGLVFPLHTKANVMTVYDLIPLHFPDYNPEAAAYFSESFARARDMDVVIAISEHTKRDVVASLGVPAEKIHVVPGAAHPQYHPIEDRAHLRSVLARYQLDRQPYVLNVGAMEHRKNVVRLVEAFARLKRADASLPHRLALVGGGDPMIAEAVMKTVRDRELDAHVSCLGYVPFEDLPALLGGADLFVFPSLFEGFGLPPLEALSCGTPVVVSDATSLPEVVGDAGLLVGPNDVDGIAAAMQRVLTDRGLHAALREKGLEQAKRFSWERTARLTREAYEDAWQRWQRDGARRRKPGPKTKYQTLLHEWVVEKTLEHVASGARAAWAGGWP